MKLASIDPASNKSAVAVWNNGKLDCYFKVKTFAKDIYQFLKKYKISCIFIEGQYYHRNLKSFESLIAARVVWTAMADYLGIKYKIIPPQTWQIAVLGCSHKDKRADRKAMAISIASSIADDEIKDSDIADAICIGIMGKKKAV